MLKRFQSLLFHKEDEPKRGCEIPTSSSCSQVSNIVVLDKKPLTWIGCDSALAFSNSSSSSNNSSNVNGSSFIGSSSSNKNKNADIDHHVQKGIEYHELGELEKATHHFRLCAKEGSPIGMFLYGISLRHGWGCKSNSALAFQYLQKAAEHAVTGLQNSCCCSGPIEYDSLLASKKGELVIAIYELGVSFQQGWGVPRSRETAFYYFKIAAQLGDADAQNEVGHCYYNGYGTKKDPYQAAKYYRMAAAQGRGLMGNSWIFKPKYDS